MQLATDFETKAAKNKALRDYLPIALIHHHPFSFQGRAETQVQKALSSVGLSDERFLSLEDADTFINWCAGRKIPLILHGHTHIPRHVIGRVTWNNGSVSAERDLTAVGCGTTLGAEGLPLSYNLLEWDPVKRNWTV